MQTPLSNHIFQVRFKNKKRNKAKTIILLFGYPSHPWVKITRKAFFVTPFLNTFCKSITTMSYATPEQFCFFTKKCTRKIIFPVESSWFIYIDILRHCQLGKTTSTYFLPNDLSPLVYSSRHVRNETGRNGPELSSREGHF